MIVPECQRAEILEKIHQAHQGVEKQGHVYFGRILTRTLRLEYKNVKSAKKAKTHKPRKHWNHMKYLLDHGKL